VETALKWGEGTVVVLHQLPEDPAAGSPPPGARPASNLWTETQHSTRALSPATGKSLREGHAQTFLLQLARKRACPVCHGLGQKMVFDEALIVPDGRNRWTTGPFCPGGAEASGW